MDWKQPWSASTGIRATVIGLLHGIKIATKKVVGTAVVWVRNTFERSSERVKKINFPDLLNRIIDFIKKNPKLIATIVTSIVFAIVPCVVVGPVLGAMGFSTVGPVAGSAAAGFQAVNGATFGFNVLQSAAMAGYGVVAVHAVVRAIAVAVAVVAAWCAARKADQ